MTKGNKGATTPRATVEGWLERDLTEAASRARGESGSLKPAFDVDDAVMGLGTLLQSGSSVFITGEAGVGKTAVVHELVRRATTDPALESLRDVRFLQLSVRYRLARLANRNQLGPEFTKLVDALPLLPGRVIPFFRDGHLLTFGDIPSQLSRLALNLGAPVIAEGHPRLVQELFEDEPEMETLFVTHPIEEPSVEAAIAIVEKAEEATVAADASMPRLSQQAIEEGVLLGHRFLARSRLPKKAFDLLEQARSSNTGQTVSLEGVLDRFCTVHGTPRWLVDPRVPLDIDAFEARIRSQLLGQNDAVDAVSSMVASIKAGLSDHRRPFGVFLFAGPTGVGKTHLAQILATELFGRPERMVRFNLGDYGEPGAPGSLFGIPHAYQPSARRGVLTSQLLGKPFAVLLLDELEKAHESVHDRLLPLFDEGSFINGAGETVSLRSMIIVATTNAGAEVYRGQGLGFAVSKDLPGQRAEVERRIRRIFRFELLNRFDRIVHFHPLDREQTRQVADRELRMVANRIGLRRRGVTLDVDEAVLDWLAVHGYDAHYGARFLKRVMEREVTTAIADTLAREPFEDGARVALTVSRNRVRARIATRGAKPQTTSLSTAPGGAVPSGPALDPDSVLDEANGLLTTLADHEREREELLGKMGKEGFWDTEAERTATVERFRTVDVAVGIEQRLARPILALRDALRDAPFSELPNGAGLLGQARAALRRWQERRRLEGPSAAWLVVSAVDAFHPPEKWLAELAGIELAYCRRAELHGQVEAFELRQEKLVRVVLEVEGPGASHFLSGEVGIHRRRRGGDHDVRAHVELVPQGGGGATTIAVRTHARRHGPLSMSATASARFKIPTRGQRVELLGREGPTLERLAQDLWTSWSRPAGDTPEECRVYGEPSGSVVDPRTGASVPWRVAGKGRLEPFFEAWRRSTTRDVEGSGARASTTGAGDPATS